MEDDNISEIRLRAIALASKLGEMAEVYSLGEDIEEQWLTWAVEQVVMAVRDQSATTTTTTTTSASASSTPRTPAQPHSEHSPNPNQILTQIQTDTQLPSLNLPPWLTKTDLGAPIEALAAFYERVGKWECVPFSPMLNHTFFPFYAYRASFSIYFILHANSWTIFDIGTPIRCIPGR
jgi:hypothetical protein